MFAVVSACVIVLVLLLISEYMWRVKRIHTEITRKFVHVTVGSFVAFWPLFMSWHTIELLSLAFLVVVVLSKYLKIFHSIHNIRRQTRGEALFAVGVGLTAAIAHQPWIFTVSILHLSLADGLAAIVGTEYGNGRRYKVFKHTKSLLGTLTFWLTSIAILSIFVIVHGPHYLWPITIWLPPLATLIENVGVQGMDNVLVPVVVATVLRLLG